MVRLGKESFLPSLLSLGQWTQKSSSRVGRGPILRFDPLTGISSSAGRENPCIYSWEHRARELIQEWVRDRDFWASWKGPWALDEATVGAADVVASFVLGNTLIWPWFWGFWGWCWWERTHLLCRRHKRRHTATIGHVRLPCSVPLSGYLGTSCFPAPTDSSIWREIPVFFFFFFFFFFFESDTKCFSTVTTCLQAVLGRSLLPAARPRVANVPALQPKPLSLWFIWFWQQNTVLTSPCHCNRFPQG